jgi:hypothetical protein
VSQAKRNSLADNLAVEAKALAGVKIEKAAGRSGQLLNLGRRAVQRARTVHHGAQSGRPAAANANCA